MLSLDGLRNLSNTHIEEVSTRCVHTSHQTEAVSELGPLSRKTWPYPNKQSANDRNFGLTYWTLVKEKLRGRVEGQESPQNNNTWLKYVNKNVDLTEE